MAPGGINHGIAAKSPKDGRSRRMQTKNVDLANGTSMNEIAVASQGVCHDMLGDPPIAALTARSTPAMRLAGRLRLHA